jgi:sugar phosphate isomerase/epimerase
MRRSIILDELGDDVGAALDACERLGLEGVELRTLAGRSVVEASDAEFDRTAEEVGARGFSIVALATPVLKCSLPGLPAPAGALHGWRAEATIEDSWRGLERALELAERHGIPFVRTFSGWRVPDPSAVTDRIAEVLAEALRRAESSSVEVLLENEHDCNVGTARETSEILALVPGLRVIWDPGNHVCAGGDPDESALDDEIERIAHLHLKDADADNRWVPLGTGRVPFETVVPRLLDAGFDGVFSLETHCEVDGSVEAASRVGLEHLRAITEVAA